MTRSNTHKSKAQNPVRILSIIARLNIGGPAIQAIALSDSLTQRHYATCLVAGKVGPGEGDMSYLAVEKGFRPIILQEFGRQISPLNDLISLQILRKIMKTFRPHIVHTHTAKAGTLGRLAAISLNLTRKEDRKIRLVHTFHGHVFHSYFGRLKTSVFIQIERLLARFTDRIIVLSPLQKEDICRRFRITKADKIRIIPFGLDLSTFSSPKNEKKGIREKYLPHDPGNTLLVGIVGRLAPVKNHRMFLEAVKELMDRGEDKQFRFLIVGDGELREELEKYAAALGVRHAVVFTGWQKDMPAVYGALDIVVTTSLNEGTPVTLIEAMASGKPVVATDVGGIRDLFGMIENCSDDGYKLAENGILIPSGKPEVLARALLHIRGKRERFKHIGERAQKFALRQFSLERLINDIESLYNELVIAA